MPIMFLPMILVGVVSSFASINVALAVLAVTGLAGYYFSRTAAQAVCQSV